MGSLSWGGAPTRISPSGPSGQDNPYSEALNRAQKYVASTALKEPLPWVVLGSGTRVFPEDALVRLELIESVTTTKGVVIATYTTHV